MAVEIRSVGTVRSGAPHGGHPVRAYSLAAGDLTAEVWDFGATLVRLELPVRSGGRTNVVLRHDGLDGYDDPAQRAGYLGATIGRWANRIRDGRCTVAGLDLELRRNDAPHHLHGGVGFDQYVWDAEIDPTSEAAVVLRRVSAGGEEGYPGRLEVSVRYELGADSLDISYEAVVDEPTIVNLTNHSYWNLSGGGRIDDHVVRIPATQYLPVDEGSIPVGGRVDVEGSRFDFRTARPLGPFEGDPIAAGYDHCLLPDGEGFRSIAEVHDPASGRLMTVESDQPCVQLYTGNYLDEPHTAVCLETQRAPDAPNQPDLGRSALLPGETYRHHTVHTFAQA